MFPNAEPIRQSLANDRSPSNRHPGAKPQAADEMEAGYGKDNLGAGATRPPSGGSHHRGKNRREHSGNREETAPARAEQERGKGQTGEWYLRAQRRWRLAVAGRLVRMSRVDQRTPDAVADAPLEVTPN